MKLKMVITIAENNNKCLLFSTDIKKRYRSTNLCKIKLNDC